MTIESNEVRKAVSASEDAQRRLRQEIAGVAAEMLVTEAARIAPAEDDFEVAYHVEDVDGDHALITVEDEIARWMSNNDAAIDAFRDSVEWDPDTRLDDGSRAALAAVNEALNSDAFSLWNDHLDERSDRGHLGTLDTYLDVAHVRSAYTAFTGAQQSLANLVRAGAATMIADAAAKRAPDEIDIDNAWQVEDEDGIDALMSVDDELSKWMARNTVAIDAFRSSEEWDQDRRGNDADRAALAAANEAINHDVQSAWSKLVGNRAPKR